MTKEINIEEGEKVIVNVRCGCCYALDSKNGVVYTIGNCPKHDEQLQAENDADNLAREGYLNDEEKAQ
jgi:hypothetical protein